MIITNQFIPLLIGWYQQKFVCISLGQGAMTNDGHSMLHAVSSSAGLSFGRTHMPMRIDVHLPIVHSPEETCPSPRSLACPSLAFEQRVSGCMANPWHVECSPSS